MLNQNEREAVSRLKQSISEKYALDKMILFGSKARGDSRDDSDIDLLVLLNQQVTTKIEDDIYDMAYEQELSCAVVFGLIIYDNDFWNKTGLLMPLRWNIDKEGIAA